MTHSWKKLLFSSFFLSLLAVPTAFADGSADTVSEYKEEIDQLISDAYGEMHTALRYKVAVAPIHRAFMDLSIAKAKLKGERNTFILYRAPSPTNRYIRHDVYLADTKIRIGAVLERSRGRWRGFGTVGQILNWNYPTEKTTTAWLNALNNRADLTVIKDKPNTWPDPTLDKEDMPAQLTAAYNDLRQIVSKIALLMEMDERRADPNAEPSVPTGVLTRVMMAIAKLETLDGTRVSGASRIQLDDRYLPDPNWKEGKWNLYKDGYYFGYAWEKTPGKWVTDPYVAAVLGISEAFPSTVTTQDDVKTHLER